MKFWFAVITACMVVIYGVIYFVYYILAVERDNGIGPDFFIFTIILYFCFIIGLGCSSCHYTRSIKLRWGDSFDAAIRRINQISISLILGFVTSSALLVCLIILDDYTDNFKLALTTCN
jgi:hypothetical protein